MMGKYIVLFESVFGLDYFLKRQAERHLPEAGTPKKIWKGRIALHRYTNKGICFGILAGKEKVVKAAASAAAGIAALQLVILWIRKAGWLAKTAAALVLGGSLSNLYDRLARGGVTDYFSFAKAKPQFLRRLVFNLGDMAILAGTLLSLFGNRGRKKK